ncbi:MAG: hypothetical protein HQK53_06170, partial [Oligoflexia bacterium]|nr:hypothetical protein [Oligoflexia bacterium]
LNQIIYKALNASGAVPVPVIFPAFPQNITQEELVAAMERVVGRRALKITLPLLLLKLLSHTAALIKRYGCYDKIDNFRLTPDKFLELAEKNWTCTDTCTYTCTYNDKNTLRHFAYNYEYQHDLYQCLRLAYTPAKVIKEVAGH